ncbi:probable protein phosphatase 2C 26 isoform X3 [Rosa chinensis]|uniref:probable protein phosphatase 2C 26 isoform X3 n=1 Tax=Rosa chinensis TaxID=74649 RepID=UPI001AD8E55C|nr:probable protein phosphatase 2C 26 isoform X3 [Rosa chinensis]
MAVPIFRASVPKSHPLIHSLFSTSFTDETLKKRRMLVSCAPSATKPVREELSFCVGTHLIPHPSKVEKGGEDAFFVSTYNGGVIAVADGVSGWAEQKVDPSLFPKELMAYASSFVEDVEQVNDNPQVLIGKAHAATSSIGSATVIVAMLERNGILKIANVGDCGLRVIREVVSSVELVEGDTIVMGSDGLFDNVFDHEIVSNLTGYKDVAEAAKALANLASNHSLDAKFDSPYIIEARARGFEAPFWKKILGMKLTGGKPDDITVVVGQVVSL